jgi:hypothetical protein
MHVLPATQDSHKDTRYIAMMNEETFSNIGVLSVFDVLRTELKSASLIFDKIAIPNIASESSLFMKAVRQEFPMFDYLLDQGIVIDPVRDYTGVEAYRRAIGAEAYEQKMQELDAFQIQRRTELQYALTHPTEPESDSIIDVVLAEMAAAGRSFWEQLMLELYVPAQKLGHSVLHAIEKRDYDQRRLACDLVTKHRLNAFPIYPDMAEFDDDFHQGKSTVLELALHSIPEPALDQEPWERIIDFRDAPTTRELRLAFRRWVSGISHKNLTPVEIWEELEDLCIRHVKHMEAHKLAVRRRNRSIVLTAAAGVTALTVATHVVQDALASHSLTSTVGNIMANGFVGGSISYGLNKLETWFSISERRASLHQAELQSPGREVAYIARIREEFGSDIDE